MEQFAVPTPEQIAALYVAFDSDPTPIIEFLAWLLPSYGLEASAPRVLDVGCGPGRLLAPLAERGWRVQGMEPDAAYRRYAAEIAAQHPGASVAAGGFADISSAPSEAAPYDLVVGVNGSFAYLLTPRERSEALARCRAVLRPGGLLFLDLPNMLRILFEYAAPSALERRTEERHIRLERRHEVDYQRATFTTFERYLVREPDGSSWETRQVHPYAITTWPELERALHDASFDDVRTYTSYAARTIETLGPGRMLIAARAS
jgi:SAM-dependent methyltransferase